MSTVTDIALRAAQERSDQRSAAEQQRRAEAQRADDRKRAARHQTIARSPLGEWFPGVQWEIVDFTAGANSGYDDGYSCVVSPAGERDIKLLLEQRARTLEGPTGPPIVKLVTRYPDELGSHYWSGPQIREPADLGDALAARKDQP